jgi:hypothetical protein
MSMFDEIIFICPNCGNDIIAQSHTGKCEMKKYTYDNVPLDAAWGAVIYDPCTKCGSSYKCYPELPDINVLMELEQK